MPGASVRRATKNDLEAVSVLAGQLVRMHHASDPARFFLPERVEDGYVWWLGRELERSEARVLLAERDGKVVGYAYGTLEERDWNLLIDEHGVVHDLFVAEEERRGGVGRELLDAMIRELEELGAPRVLLYTLVTNERAQQLFRSSGFRPTLLEMTRERPNAR
jgi:ribosomal protein S18 acetylase RimI-like enzyme